MAENCAAADDEERYEDDRDREPRRWEHDRRERRVNDGRNEKFLERKKEEVGKRHRWSVGK